MPKHRSGDLISRLTNDIAVLGEGIRNGVFTLISSLVTVVGLLLLMLWYSMPLTLLTMALIAPMSLAAGLVMAKIKARAMVSQQQLGVLNNLGEETIRAIKEIKSYGNEEWASDIFIRQSQIAVRYQNSQDKMRSIAPGVLSCETFVTIGILVLVCSWMIHRGHLEPERLTAFVTCLLLIFTPISRIANSLGFVSKILAVMERFQEVLSAPSEPVHDRRLQPIPEIRGGIRFNKVCFAYDSRFALKNLTFEVHAGEFIAIVGPSGSGKTTVLNLLLRFLHPQSGAIHIDGFDISKYRIDSLRRQIGLVPQEPVLFEGSLYENLCFAKRAATMEEVVTAAKSAHVDEFARTLTGGYQGSIGEYGSMLSAGQRQRIAIARAILADARILILDEPTSALDSTSERLVNDSLREIRKGRTMLIVAHRLSTIQNADRILVLENGSLTQCGSHSELTKEEGLYRRLYADYLGTHGERTV
jgi:subfamily B ATP-binding cassette protein MsbA